MIRNWKVLALSALLAGAAPSQPLLAGSDLGKVAPKAEEKVGPSNEQVLAEIRKLESTILLQIGKVKADLKEEVGEVKEEQFKHKLQLQTLQALAKKIEEMDGEVLNLTAEVRKLRKLLAAEPALSPAAPAADRSGMDDLLRRLSAIEQALAKLQTTTPSTSGRTSLAAPTGPSLGRVMLVNHYNEDMLFIVNGKDHRVGPGASRSIDAVPTGPLTYEVLSPTWGRRALQTITLMPNETLTLTAAR